MKMMKISAVMMGMAFLAFAGCGSSDSTEGTPDAGGPAVYGISPGAYCYTITDITAVNDGCEAGVATLKGTSVPGNYDAATGIFTLGNQGKLGGGVITYNQGTLTRVKGLQTDPADPTCSWNVELTTQVTMTAENKFTGLVTENQDTIAAGCGLTITTCQTTWTGTFAIDGTQNAAAGCK
jgi:hypothetical protein